MNAAEFDRLLQMCYQGPLEKNLWASFLQGLQQALAARFVTLLLRPPKAGDKGVVLNAFVSSDDAYHEYKEHYFAQNPFLDLPLDKAFTADDILDINTFKASEYYLQYLKPLDVEYILGINFEDDNGFSARLRISRGEHAKNFTVEEKHFVEKIIPHLKQAIVLYTRIVHAEAKVQSYQDAFNQMDMGCIILDRNLHVLSRNRAAEDLMKEHACLYIKDRQLMIGSREESRHFKATIDSMIALQDKGGHPDVSALRIETPHSMAGLGLLCRVMPPSATPDAGPSIVVFISDPEKPRLSKVTILEQLFGLTLSEAKLTLLLANGLSLDEAAEELCITRNTAKSHLSSTFAKTGVTRQPSLVQLILRSVASVG